MDIDTVQAILSAMSDRSRLLLLHDLLEKPRCVEELAEREGLSASTVSFHLRKLELAGIVRKTREQYYSVFNLNIELLKLSLEQLLAFENPIRTLREEREFAARKMALGGLFRNGTLPRIPVQRKKRLLVIGELVKSFETGRRYPETEVNEILRRFNPDYCLLRRLLVDEGLMGREHGIYWVTENPNPGTPDPFSKSEGCPQGPRPSGQGRAIRGPGPTLPHPAVRPGASGTSAQSRGSCPQVSQKGTNTMDRQREMKRAYKEMVIPAGIVRIKHLESGKIFLAGSLNLSSGVNRNRFQLEMGKHPNDELQADWKRCGPDAFQIDILETIEPPKDGTRLTSDDIQERLKFWLDDLQPFGERGYHTPKEKA